MRRAVHQAAHFLCLVKDKRQDPIWTPLKSLRSEQSMRRLRQGARSRNRPVLTDCGMQNALVAVLHRRRSRLKAEWHRRLSARPTLTTLADPAILLHLMDVTLDQLASLLQARSPTRWLEQHRPI